MPSLKGCLVGSHPSRGPAKISYDLAETIPQAQHGRDYRWLGGFLRKR